MLNLAIVLEDSAQKHPDRTALVQGDVRMPYSMVDALANQVADLLVARGIGPGDKVALACPNLPYFPLVYFGALKAGAVVVPLNVLSQARELSYFLEDSDAKALFCFEGTPDLPLGQRGKEAFDAVPGTEHFIVLPAAAPATESSIEGAETLWGALQGACDRFESVQTSADDTAVILYTSGTTGHPKGAELTHQNMLMNAMINDELVTGRPGEDSTLAVLPLFHSFGQSSIMNAGLRRGAKLVLMPRFDPVEALSLMREERVTLFAGVPTMYWALLSAVRAGGLEVPALESAVSGGAALPLEVLKDFREVFGVQILEGYGLSETAPTASFNQLSRPTKPGSIGFPVWGVQMKLVDGDGKTVEGEGPGEVAIRGHNVMKGYYKRPEATAEAMRDGWFRTGDIARRDEDGYYFIVDRAKDMIIRGGFNVYPREVEEVLIAHEAVSLAAVVGAPHDTHGEEVTAFVVPEAGTEPTEEELVAWCRDRLAAFKYPRSVELRESLPMNATGKILKRELR
ncbi:long-chain-fatty-acid--CoA ligase [Streptomonospora wellingtoniae]|uniref:Long-chain fatty acid--CoA ligase n=1 Tax=Streptomonospora wellingtoniae TaxID=3075544 RepID=A0ABU2KRD8_9ACTN|nr:long-chain fatty acid--CoA ligase [Streptomonospora sp. DSM 45055]MDT0301849.1 long-chain fatty acid--CoA ligase [Streptomonospora sp. DSM 45055]